jgi:hypothetical protein
METKIALMSDQLTVRFVEVLERYPYNEDIECRYMLNNYKVQDGDRVAIFKMGWKSLRNYVLFEWAVDSSLANLSSVIFSKYDLPNSPNDLYQFCYISGENVVQGISTPFQISGDEPKSTFKLSSPPKKDEKNQHLRQLLTLKDQEILRLKEENAILRESLKSMVEQRRCQRTKNYDDDINELKDVTKKLKDAILGQQVEMESLKMEIKKDRASQKNLMLEKILAEKKFDAISRKSESSNIKRLNFDFDIGNLESVPPFPFNCS